MARRPPRRRYLRATLADRIGVGDVARHVYVTLGVPAPPVLGTYGPGIAMDSLANTRVGGPFNTKAAMRFRAEQSSTLTAYRTYWLDQSYVGYGGGTGGILRVTLQTDLGGVPSGTVLASAADVVSPAKLFVQYSFPTPATLAAGTLYHLVFENVDPDPIANYGSLDAALYRGTEVPLQPRDPNDDYEVFYRNPEPSSWVARRYTPIVDLTYGNGSHQGVGYYQVNLSNIPTISGTTHMVRERFTVSGGDRVVTGFTVRLAKFSGTGDVVFTLEDSAGATIDSCSVSTASLPVGAAPGVRCIWASGSFSEPRTLVNGQSYRLRVSTDALTSLWTLPMNQASSYGFNAATYFSDGALEATTDGVTWIYLPGSNNLGELQSYFTTIE